MKINFQQIKVKDIIKMVGTLDYMALIALAKEHGIAATEVYFQLQESLNFNEVTQFKPFGRPVMYQDPGMGKRLKDLRSIHIDQDEVVQIEKFIQTYDKKFRAGDVLKDLIDKEMRRWEGEKEIAWDKEHVSAALRELKKMKRVDCGPPSKQGLWYWLPSWKPKEKK